MQGEPKGAQRRRHRLPGVMGGPSGDRRTTFRRALPEARSGAGCVPADAGRRRRRTVVYRRPTGDRHVGEGRIAPAAVTCWGVHDFRLDYFEARGGRGWPGNRLFGAIARRCSSPTATPTRTPTATPTDLAVPPSNADGHASAADATQPSDDAIARRRRRQRHATGHHPAPTAPIRRRRRSTITAARADGHGCGDALADGDAYGDADGHTPTATATPTDANGYGDADGHGDALATTTEQVPSGARRRVHPQGCQRRRAARQLALGLPRRSSSRFASMRSTMARCSRTRTGCSVTPPHGRRL